jgi:hypothetical protein
MIFAAILHAATKAASYDTKHSTIEFFCRKHSNALSNIEKLYGIAKISLNDTHMGVDLLDQKFE